MRYRTLLVIFFLHPCFSYGQESSFITGKKSVLTHAQQIVQSILGKDLYRKHVWIDTLDSHIVPQLKYTTDFRDPKVIGQDTAYMIIFGITKQRDTLGFVTLYVDKYGKLLPDSKDPFSYSTPELLVGYKRALLNDFKLNFLEAFAVGRKKGFSGAPILYAVTDYSYSILNKNVYVKVNYFWNFFDMNNGGSTLVINAETGEITKEQYIPRMPK